MKTPLTAGRVFLRLSHEVIVKALAALTVMHNPAKECKGGILSILVQGPEGSTYESRHLGDPGKYTFDRAFFAAEKMRRLATRRLSLGPEECAASQSANPDKQMWGGCIVASIEEYEIFISFSGAPAVVDEIVAYVIAESLGFTVSAGYDYVLLPPARELLKGCALAVA